MTDDQTTNVTVEARIERFIAKKALQYPRLGLAVMNPKVVESTLKPMHEVLADKILEKHSKSISAYLLALIKAYPISSYGRTTLVK